MDLVDRLQRKLREVVGERFPERGSPACTIAELYQQLIPYRAVRGELGIMELAEYEHALLRLLSGERGYLRLDQPDVQREFREELASPNPILGVYRDYAGVGIELMSPEVTLEAPEQTVPDPTPEAVAPPPAVPLPPAPSPATPVTCRSCQAALPDSAELRFCPFCGTNQRDAACSECGLLLKPDWNFCIRCGTPHPERRVS